MMVKQSERKMVQYFLVSLHGRLIWNVIIQFFLCLIHINLVNFPYQHFPLFPLKSQGSQYNILLIIVFCYSVTILMDKILKILICHRICSLEILLLLMCDCYAVIVLNSSCAFCEMNFFNTTLQVYKQQWVGMSLFPTIQLIQRQ